MKRICAWCGKEMPVQNPDSETTIKKEDDAITHGMCEACAVTVMAEIDSIEVNEKGNDNG